MINSLELWHTSASGSELREIPVEAPKENEVLVESVFSMISSGTERTVSLGNVPDEMGETMRVPYMKGQFSFPCTYGYSLVGMVMQGPDDLIGHLVHVMHPHKSVLTLSRDDIFLVPGFIPARRATLASNMETAVNAVWDSGVSAGDKVLMVGFGIIGSLIALLIRRIPGVDIVVIESNQARAEKAISFGFKVITNARKAERNFDLAFNTSGSGRGLQTALDALALEGKVVELSWYGADAVNLRLGQSFHYLRKQIISSQVSHIPMLKSGRWDYKRRKDLVFKLLKEDTFDALITQEVPFRNAPSFFKKLRNEDLDDIGVVFSYR